ncbi:MAG: hypothetical protein WCD70_08400 [Alphaproteobacteria bacterium]
MKFLILTPSILVLSCALMLMGCDSVKLRNPFLDDQVPPEAKAEPRLVTTPPPPSPTDAKTWPRLVDVPFKPKDFSPQPAYTHYMDELEYDRAESETAKKQVVDESPALPDAAPPNVVSTGPRLMPPQLPQSPQE